MGSRLLFQFAPLREGRHRKSPVRKDSDYFNSRPCVRGDLDDVEAGDLIHTISIRAPA